MRQPVTTLLEQLHHLLEMAAKRRGISDPNYGFAADWAQDKGGTIRGTKRGRGSRPESPVAWGGITPEDWPEAFTRGGFPKAGTGQRAMQKVMKKLAHLMSQYADHEDLELSEVERTALEMSARGTPMRSEARLVASIAARAAQYVIANPGNVKGGEKAARYVAGLFAQRAEQIMRILADNPVGRGFADWRPSGTTEAAAKKAREAHKKAMAALKRQNIRFEG